MLFVGGISFPMAEMSTVIDTTTERKDLIRHHLAELREAARWYILRDYDYAPRRRARLIEEFMEAGRSFQLTEREMAILLLAGLFTPAR